MEVEVAGPLPQVVEPLLKEKDNSFQEAVGPFACSSITLPIALGLDEAIQQKSSYITLKEFKKQGLKKLKVISQRGLEELISQAIEEFIQRLDKERQARIALEEEVSKLRKEVTDLHQEISKRVESARPAEWMVRSLPNADWRGKLREIVRVAIEQAKDGLEEKDIPTEFITNLEKGLLKELEAIVSPSTKKMDLQSYSSSLKSSRITDPPKQMKTEQKTGLVTANLPKRPTGSSPLASPLEKRGGFFENILKENLQLRGANRGASGA